MKTFDPCLEVLSALLAARLAFPPITRTCEAWSPKSKKTYLYADLNAIIDATVPVLGAHGLLMVQSLGDGEGGTLCLTSTLFHVASGQWLRSEVSVTRPETMQDYGAACTYLKRYAQQGLFNISTESDDDASSLNGVGKAEKSAAAEKLRPSMPVNGNGHTPAPEPPKGAPKNLVQKSDLLREIQAELTRIGRPVGEVTSLYQAAFGTEVSTWNLVCGESLHTLKHGLACLKTLTPEVSDGAQSRPAQVPDSPGFSGKISSH
jgi:hypothetical protein